MSRGSEPSTPASSFKIFSQSRIAPQGQTQGHGLQVISPALTREDSVGADTIRGVSIDTDSGDGRESSEEVKKSGSAGEAAADAIVAVVPAGKRPGAPASSAMEYAVSHLGTTATSQALIKFAAGSTLLPQNIASIITSLSLLARVSLRSTAFFAEVILEAAKFSTSTSLGLTRRVLISAIGSARALHDTLNPDGNCAWDARAAGVGAVSSSSTASRISAMRNQHDGFLAVLDKYTAVGIYVIHHTFTMAELFAMSGFYLVDTSIKAGISAADESVRMIDGIFGSNETSRALSSFIALVRRELSHGDNSGCSAGDSKIAGAKALANLTKAFTAFAVLQNATYKRTAQTHKMQVLYDCTVLGEVESNSWRSMIVGPGNFVKKSTAAAAAVAIAPPPRSSSQGVAPAPVMSSALSPPATMRTSRSLAIADPAGAVAGSLHASRSHYGGNALCLTDVGSDARYEVEDFDENNDQRPSASSSSVLPVSSDREGGNIVKDLNYLIGSDGEEEQDLLSNNRRRWDQQNTQHGSFPSSTPVIRRTIRRRDPEHGTIETVYEEVTETTETIETTTISGAHAGSSSVKTAQLPNPFSPLIPAREKSKGQSLPLAPSSPHSQQSDDVWTEIAPASTRASAESTDDEMMVERELIAENIPQAPNGRPAQSIGSLARRQALDRPEESKARMQVVLRTITRKLVQKRKVVRRTQDTRGNTLTSTRESQNVENDVFSESTPSEAESLPSKLRQPQWAARFTATGDSPESAKSRKSTNSSGSFGDGGRGGKGVTSADDRLKSKSRAALQSLFSRSTIPKPGAGAAPRQVQMVDMASSRTPTPPSSPPSIAMSPPTPDKAIALPHVASPETTPKSRFALNRRKKEEEDGDQQQQITPKLFKRRSRQPSITSIRSFASTRKETHTTTNTASAQVEMYSRGQFPQQHFVTNLHTFMRHSSAAYGQNFMRIFGIGRSAEYLFADTQKHHSNIWAYAHHVGIPVDNILLSSYTEGETSFHSEKMSPIVNYISVDDDAKAVILTCRGTLGLSDVLTDLTCEYEEIAVEGRHPYGIYQVHSGMWASAIRLKDTKSTIHQTLKQALESRPGYGLVLTGHSLGGGVAAMLAIMWSSPAAIFQQQTLDGRPSVVHPPLFTPFVTSFASGLPAGRPIHAYAYGVPASASLDLSKYCSGLVTSLVHGHDLVPSLSLGTLRDMRNVAESLSDQRESKMAQEIVGAVVGLYQRKRKAAGNEARVPAGDLIDINFPRPSEPPAQEREQVFEHAEIMQGHTRNRALDSGYQDPVLKEHPLSPPLAGGKQGTAEAENDTKDWLWSLIKTMRASMGETKLYPPGDVFCIESFTVYVTPRTTRQNTSMAGMQEDRQASSRGEAHRVLLRACPDVEKRFSEPIFARSMLRDHIPTNYELCTQLLYESVVTESERQS
ncbi:hypothetical protein K437DRAFT_274489 [Tilletiaria anomala UBC 951]|uniref:sn-1-specific diacylglycerol lipase n=1 Tax=Tilletiaria anomala (strain ATCC 24038 / CBS 436.72 / UBC 951) TaxID=1037660 RepID=A0A066VWN0_TILAU|nr:uncharacterized protein K437DRAFT_274489 [Tilletiaria anomala UBC 951]KDN44703.1 hypothetical protein K437DRAFT_274489 [Tilletiaria anomala UBC 951]